MALEFAVKALGVSQLNTVHILLKTIDSDHANAK